MKLIAENTAKRVDGGYLKTRFADLLRPQTEETRTGEEIVARIRGKLGGERG